MVGGRLPPGAPRCGGRLLEERERTPQERNSRSSRSTNLASSPSPSLRALASARKDSRCSRRVRCSTPSSGRRGTYVRLGQPLAPAGPSANRGARGLHVGPSRAASRATRETSAATLVASRAAIATARIRAAACQGAPRWRSCAPRIISTPPRRPTCSTRCQRRGAHTSLTLAARLRLDRDEDGG